MADDANAFTKIPTISGGIRTRGGRLPPIRSRDLGQSSGRRVVVPNFPQRRIKKEVKIQQEETRDQSSSNKNSNRDDKRGRGRGRGRREYIQTTGSFFGQGLAEDATLKKEPRDISCLKDSSIVRPVFTLKKLKNKQEQADEDQKCLNEDEFEDDSGSDDEDTFCPIILPLKKALVKTEIKSESDIKPKIKKEKDIEEVETKIEKIEIKKEKEDEDLCNVNIKDEKKPVIKNEDVLDFFCDENASGKIFLIQFPDNLFSENMDNADASNTPETSNEKGKDENVSNLNNMKEGVIGKLQLFKSGAVKFVYGDTVMNVEQNRFFNFNEELIFMKGGAEFIAEATKLGKIEKHFTIYPPIENVADK